MMSAEIGVSWRSSTTRCSNESRSPSISSLPPLPDLIPIRKTANNNTFIKVNGNDDAIQNANSNGMANESDGSSDNSRPTTSSATTVATTATTIDQNPIDLKPNASELSSYAINNICSRSSTNGNQDDIDQYQYKTSMTTTTIKQEFHLDNEDEFYTNENANSADAVSNICVSDYTNCSTVKHNIKTLDGGQLMHVNGLNNSTLSSSVMNEKCQNGGNFNCVNDDASANGMQFSELTDTLVNRENGDKKCEQSITKCEEIRTGHSSSVSKNGVNDTINKKNQQNATVSDIPKRTTRSTLDTYECKSRLYTPLPAHYYSVQYARAARKPKRNKLKGKGRGGANGAAAGGGSVSKAGRKPKKQTAKAALMALQNAIPKTDSHTPSKINPIFLFVKRDDTRIVEVRCEDYDKRNRIKLTKTASGWRAIPRTDNPVSNLPSTMLPKVMVERLEDSNNVLANKRTNQKSDTNKSANNNNINNNHNDSNNTWRVNPFSQNRIFISKGLCSLNNLNNNNNNDDKFDSEYENRTMEQNSCSDASTSVKVHSMNVSSARRKHKKKKKKKKAKHKSKMEKLVVERQLFVSDSNASTSASASANGSFEDNNILDSAINDVGIDDGGNSKAHATQIASTKLARNSATGNASECKFTIRLSKNGESSFIATKKFSTVSTVPFATTEFSAIETTATGIKLTKQKSINNTSNASNASNGQQILTDYDAMKMEECNTDTELHSVPMKRSNEITQQCNRIEMIKLCGSDVADDDDGGDGDGDGDGADDTEQQPTTNGSATNVENSNANVLDNTLAIDCEKFDTKREVITPTMSPYHHQAYPSLCSSSQPHHQPIHTLNNSIKMQNVQNDVQIHIQSKISQTLESSSSLSSITAGKSETISNCRRNDIDTFASPDIAPVETFDPKLAVKQCIGSQDASAKTTTQSNQLNDGQQEIMCSDKLNDKDDDLVDCVDLLDESSYYDDPVVPVNGDINSNNNSNDLREYHDLIAGIQNINETHVEDEDDDMSGTELIDSLVERECKNNDIASVNVGNDHNDLKDTICLSDDYNDVDTSILLNSQPVADMLSRLNSETMSTSPKCLSFNEAGEIEGLNETLFSTSKTNSNGLVPFNHSSFEQFSMALKNLEKSNTNNNNSNNNNNQNNSPNDKDNLGGTTVVSPDSCEDELPKDLSFKKSKDIITSMRITTTPRPISRDSDTIQSPQPSGLPAVPPSPEILIALQQHNNRNQNKKQNPLFMDISLTSPKSTDGSSGKTDFLDLTSPISKDDPERSASNENANTNGGNMSNPLRSILKRTLQKEPLDLGHKHRKSASPTVSCSEEAHRVIRSDDNDSMSRRIKLEHRNDNNNLLSSNAKGNNANQSDSVSSKDPDPLTQLRLLISNPEWKLPDPILVPKNRLNAVLASPAREIPLLLTTRPELRLPEAFAYPSILQDPDILVISFAQLETIIRKQNEFMKDSDTNKTVLNKQSHNNVLSSSTQHLETLQRQQSHSDQQNQQNQHQQQMGKERKNIEKTMRDTQCAREKTQSKNVTQRATNVAQSANNGNLANDINSATLEALNQMFWLPYLSQISQLGHLTPDLIKAMSVPNLAMQQQHGFSGSNPFGLANPMANLNNPAIDLAMWQEAAVNKAAIQRIIDLNAQNVREAQREAQRKALNEAKMINRNQDSIESIHRQQNPYQSNPATKVASTFFQNLQNRSQPTKTAQPFLSPSNELQQRQTCNLQSPPLPKRPAFAANQNPFFVTPNPLANMHSNFTGAPTLPKFGIGGTNNNNNNSNRNINSSSTMSNSLRKARKEQLFQQQQQQLQSLLMQNVQQSPNNLQLHNQNQANDAANRSCRSLVNLLQQPDLEQMRANSSRNGNMTRKIPSFDLTSPTTSTSTNQPKLRVKPGLHLLDPLAAQRRFLSGNVSQRCDDSPEIGSTTSGIEDIAMNPPMHNSQAASYTSPWHWTKVTATGE